jgi:putative phosphoribosyl transferase
MSTQLGQVDTPVAIPAGGKELEGILNVPAGARGVVLFAHGSGSGRNSPRNQHVAGALHDAGLATLLLDLLTHEEETDRRNVFNIHLLADRLQVAAKWLADQNGTGSHRLGLFGASTGAAAALTLAARLGTEVFAVVSRGGRPDLTAADLTSVVSPTLLIVGGRDEVVLQLNEEVMAALRCPKQLVIIPGATHLFPEPGALEEVARLASEWFVSHPKPDS